MDLGYLEQHNLKFTKTITKWDEAIPLGNGISGALIWGTAKELRFSLDRGDIWDNTSYAGFSEEEFSFPTLVKLAREGNSQEIKRIFQDPYSYATPTKLPAGKLIFDFDCDDNIRSELQLKDAQARIQVGDSIEIHSFLHAVERVGMVRINCPSSAFSWQVIHPQFGVEGVDKKDDTAYDSLNTGSLKRLIYKMPKVVKKENEKYFIQSVDKDFSYGIFAKIKQLKDAVEIAFLVASSKDGEDWKEDALRALDESLKQGYDKMFLSHSEWWEQYWSKSRISLPDKLFEKNWYLTQYFLGSGSRKGAYPMPLQGVWTADDGTLPPWKGDYHLDLNVQMTYYSYLKANHVEEGEVLFDYLWSLLDRAREFARSFYRSRGISLPGTISLDGQPLGGWAMYSFSPTNQLWTCQLFERHYRYTGDRRFLEERAYPYLAESAECILGILEERDGKYYLPISSSPEIHDDTLKAFLTPNSNYDLALMRYLFAALAELAEDLQNGQQKKWLEILSHLPQLAVDKEGILMLSPDESLQESHRHHSHAMCIHPLRLMPYEGEKNQRIIDATILNLERLGSGFWVGFGFTWMAQLYAIQKNGNGAAHQLEMFWRHFCSQNGFDLNGDYKKRGVSQFHYRPFTLETNFCAADALQEMLLQSENNVLDLFPAVPDEWLEERVSFGDFRAEKGLLVSAEMACGEVVSVTWKPQYNTVIYVKKTDRNQKIAEAIKQNKYLIFDEKEDRIRLELMGGKEYTITIN